MSVPIKSSEMLMQVLNQDMTLVINDVADDILNNIKETVDLNVYERFPYFGDYERLKEDGGFYDAWSRGIVDIIGGCLQVDVGYDYGRMTLDGDKHQHGNTAGEDRRPIMAQIIEAGAGYDFGGNAAEDRPFWDVVERMLNDGSFDGIVEASFRKHGIQYIKAF
jgi:hypothetical protein